MAFDVKNPSDLAALANLINTDPNGRGYATHVASGNDKAIADLLNERIAAIQLTKSSITGDEFLDAIVEAEMSVLSESRQGWIRTFHLKDTINLQSTPVRQIISEIFPPGQVSRTNLIALATRDGSDMEDAFGVDVAAKNRDVAAALGRP